jgi:pilus assembly protein CpaC
MITSSVSRLRVLQLALVAAYLLLTAAAAHAVNATGDHLIYAGEHTAISVPIYESRIVELPAPVSRVTIGNPDIADVLIFNAAELYVLGKDLGNTNLLLWDRHGNVVSAISVTVTHDINALKAKLTQILPGEQIGVTSAHRNIILFGRVSSVVKMDAALQIAQSYLEQAATAKKKIMFQEQQSGGGSSEEGHAGKVINLMSVAGPQEVMLQVRVAEVQRNAVKHMNLQFLGTSNSGKWVGGLSNGGTTTFPPATWLPQNAPIPALGQPGTSGIAGPLQQLVSPTVPSISTAGLFGSYLSGSFVANAVLDAFRQEGLAKILAEPTLTTESGQEAQFLSGGSFPIPVPEQNGTIGIQYKDFGVKLGFVPVIMDDGRIDLKLDVSVSQLTSTNSLVVSPITSSTVFAVPAITERRASSSVELADGQTIGIAGLMNDSMQTAVKKFPGLGDLPILGSLFRSQDFQDGRTELVILVTPRLARPIPPGEVRLPTDSVVPPSNAGFFLLGKMEGAKGQGSKPMSAPPAPAPVSATQPPPAHP